MALEVLDGTLVLLGCLARAESAQVSAFARLGVWPSRIQPVLAGFQFSDHDFPGCEVLDRRKRVIAADRLGGDNESATTDRKERDVAA
jgi:hypothetical protein